MNPFLFGIGSNAPPLLVSSGNGGSCNDNYPLNGRARSFPPVLLNSFNAGGFFGFVPFTILSAYPLPSSDFLIQ